jgi:hypothetical protein
VSQSEGYAKHRSRSHHAVIRVYDDAGNVIQTHEIKASSKSGKAFLVSGWNPVSRKAAVFDLTLFPVGYLFCEILGLRIRAVTHDE